MLAEVLTATPASKRSRHRLLKLILMSPLCRKPICNKQIQITHNGLTVIGTIVDMCTSCTGASDLNLSPAIFYQFPNTFGSHVIDGITWQYV